MLINEVVPQSLIDALYKLAPGIDCSHEVYHQVFKRWGDVVASVKLAESLRISRRAVDVRVAFLIIFARHNNIWCSGAVKPQFQLPLRRNDHANAVS